MELKAGVLVIGSLFWEDDLEQSDNIRKKWRQQYLLNEITVTPVPIRYGRESGVKRNKTYTMIFSSHCENFPGTGLILPFKLPVRSFEDLELQAIALAIAEGIYKKDNRRITTGWGSVGLLMNPSLHNRYSAINELVVNKWENIYSQYSQTFFSELYKTDHETMPVITSDGFINIQWRKEMDEFDLLIATPVIPKPPRLLTAKEIGEKLNEKGYRRYFDKNQESDIITFQDDEILEILK